MIELKLPDGKALAVEDGISAGEAVRMIGEGLLRKAVAGKIDGEMIDLSRNLTRGGEFKAITLAVPEGEEMLRHSAAHVMADAVQQLFPTAKVTIGPAIEKGFYYDFDYPPGFTPEDFEKIEAKMAEIVK